MPFPDATGYYGGSAAAQQDFSGSPHYPVRTPGMFVNPSGGVGIPNPNEADGGWYATNLGGGGIQPVTGDQYRTLTDSTHSNRELIQSAARIAALIYGGGALSGSLGGAGLGFGSGAAGVGDVASGYGISPGFASGADGLAPVTTGGAAMVPGGTAGGFLGGLGTDTMAAFPSLGGAAAGVGGGLGAGSMPAAGGGVEAIGGPTTTGLYGQSVPATGWGPAAGTVGGAAAAGGLPSWVGNYLVPGVNSVLGANAATTASGNLVDANNAAIAEQKRQYDQNRTDLMPWLTAGQGALGKLQDPGTNFTASPGYAFRRSEGNRNIENMFSAKGGAQSGNALKALDEYNQNLASGEFGNWWNQQAGLAGVGQNTALNLGDMGATSSARVGNYLSGIGDARASGVLGRNASLAGGLNQSIYNLLYRRGGP